MKTCIVKDKEHSILLLRNCKGGETFEFIDLEHLNTYAPFIALRDNSSCAGFMSIETGKFWLKESNYSLFNEPIALLTPVCITDDDTVNFTSIVSL